MSKTIKTSFISDKINGIAINSSLKCNSSNYTNDSEREIAYIVMHYTGNSKDTAKANANYFTGANREASAHLFVDDTNIYQSVELRDVAWHCGTTGTYYHNKCRNDNSIGIEMCCTAGNYKISDKTKKNAAYLCAYLCKMIGITSKQVDTYVLRHYDITHKKCPAQMVSDSAEWTAFKNMVRNVLDTGNVDGKKEEPKTTAKIKANDIVKIASGAKYYTGKAIPSWVQKLNWHVVEVEGNRAVLGKSEDGKNSINSPVDVKYLTVVKAGTKTTTVKTEPVIDAGKKVVLSKCPIYASSGSLLSSGKITGTYYLWDANPVKNRIRITNSKENVGKSQKVTGWIKVSNVK